MVLKNLEYTGNIVVWEIYSVNYLKQSILVSCPQLLANQVAHPKCSVFPSHASFWEQSIAHQKDKDEESGTDAYIEVSAKISQALYVKFNRTAIITSIFKICDIYLYHRSVL